MLLSARPYSRLVPVYDEMLGTGFFRKLRRAFEALARRYRIRFASAADLGCGTGLFARYLARCWDVPVFAVDASPEMLTLARCRCSDPRVRWLRQDIRNLCLPEPVDLITANFDTLNHLVGRGDLQQAFRRIHASLRPGGWFLFDFVTPCEPLGGHRVYVRQHSTAEALVTQHVRWMPRQRLLQIRVVHSRWRRPCLAVERHLERAYSPDEIAGALFDAGFTIRGVHDLETARRAAHCLPRLLVLAQRHARSLRHPQPN